MYVSEIARAVAANIGDEEDLPIAALSAAIPYYFVRLNAICVERRELDILQEFILRALGLGLSDEATVAGFLGSRTDEVVDVLSGLEDEYFVVRNVTSGAYALTEKGISAISQNGLQRISERVAGCHVNGITRRVEQVSETLVPRRKVPYGTFVLPSVPARPPKLDELDVAGVRAAMLLARSPLPRIVEIARLGRIIRSTSLFQGGHLLLRRGSHSVPLICIHGSAETDLARILGGHPALQAVKSEIEGSEKRARSLIRRLVPRVRTSTLLPPSVVRRALMRLIAFADAPRENVGAAKQEFSDAAETLVAKTHWMMESEWHVLFAKAIIDARKRFVMVAPLASPVLEIGELDRLGDLAKRGVQVELIIPQEDARMVERDERLRTALEGVRLELAPSHSGWFGFFSDRGYVVVGISRHGASTMGSYDVFCGALIAGESNPEQLLRDCAQSPSIPVSVKKKARVPGRARER